MKRICIIGLGYIGLPTAATFASNGFDVLGVDINSDVVQRVNDAVGPEEEPGLKALVKKAVKSGKLKAASEPKEADVFIIAVPTPLDSEKQPDLSFVESASRSVARRLRNGNLVILESTVPPGTTEGIVKQILEESGLEAGREFLLAHCPERVLPGDILRELKENERVIGGIDPASTQLASDLYKSFVTGHIHPTTAIIAETTKLVENIYRDVNIALANELSNVCSKLGVNVWEVIELANKHPRVNLHSPGPGVGGHCIGVVPWFLVNSAPESTQFIQLAREINDSQPSRVANRILDIVKDIPNPKITLLGVAYKANVGDTRETPALSVIRRLEEASIQIAISDPHVREFCRPMVTLKEALTGADALVVVTDHREFKDIAPQWAGRLMRTKIVLDTRNCLDRPAWQRAGFQAELLGT